MGPPHVRSARQHICYEVSAPLFRSRNSLFRAEKYPVISKNRKVTQAACKPLNCREELPHWLSACRRNGLFPAAKSRKFPVLACNRQRHMLLRLRPPPPILHRDGGLKVPRETPAEARRFARVVSDRVLRAPVPQSKISRSPLLVVTSTQDVLPPKTVAPGPGVAIDPVFPRNLLS